MDSVVITVAKLAIGSLFGSGVTYLGYKNTLNK